MAVKRPDTTLYAKIIADIWKSGCGGCTEYIGSYACIGSKFHGPEIQQVYGKYHSKGRERNRLFHGEFYILIKTNQTVQKAPPFSPPFPIHEAK